ncbi:hypothetical protein Tco_0484431 [Tanacetum coccineum]
MARSGTNLKMARLLVSHSGGELPPSSGYVDWLSHRDGQRPRRSDMDYVGDVWGRTRTEGVEDGLQRKTLEGIRRPWFLKRLGHIPVQLSSDSLYELASIQDSYTDCKTSGQLSAALGQIQALQARGQTHADDREGAGKQICHQEIICLTARADSLLRLAAPYDRCCCETTNEQVYLRHLLILGKSFRNSTNGHGDGSHNSDTRIRGTGTEGSGCVDHNGLRRWNQCSYSASAVENSQLSLLLAFLGNCSDGGELPHEDYYSRCCLCYRLEGTKEDDDS